MAALSIEIQELLNNHKSLKVLENGKIQCQLSGHELPCRLDAIEQYISGKKYQQLKKKLDLDLTEYKEHLEPNKKKGREHQLYCKLTRRIVNNTSNGIQIHISGQKFQKALKKWKLCKETGTTFSLGKNTQKMDDDDDFVIKRSRKGKEEEEDGWESDDSYSDLYPEADFKNLNLNDDGKDETERGTKRKGDKKVMRCHQPIQVKRSKN